jgi:3-carboxy-cis,cis-muconate cycloisomerase
MTDLLWPGDERAGDHLTDAAYLRAMVSVETAWLEALVAAGVAPAAAVADLAGLAGLVSDEDAAGVALDAEASGNPVVPLVALLRELLGGSTDASRWLHRGLTSQDVVDTALMLGARDAVAAVRADLRGQVRALADLALAHRHTPMVARTLTQYAVPTTFGFKVAQWLTGVLDAHDDLTALVFPVQVGGAAGTMAAAVELAGASPNPVPVATDLTVDLATRLGLTPSTPWHTTRTTITRLGDAAVRCTDAWGRLANDVLTLSRPEIGELSEGAGGGSSTMPHKANPVLSVQVRRAALAAPQLAATLHLAAAESVDERADGAWHTEWATLRTLLRRTLVAGSQTSELLAGLKVHADRMATRLAGARDDVRAEQRSMSELAGTRADGDYLGAADALLEAPLARAAGVLAEEAR